MTQQFDLFEDQTAGSLETEESEDSRLNEWSHSRRQVFEKCQRLYYYHYYGASGRTAKEEPLKERLKFLKGLSSRYMRAGSLMHLAIRCSLKGREGGREWSPSFLVDFAHKKFSEDIEFSKRFRAGNPLPEGSRAPSLLLEFVYAQKDAEKLCRESDERLTTALRNFASNADYQVFRAGVDGGGARIEVASSTRLTDFRVRGQVDLAFSNTGRVTIVDWKMGLGEGGDDSLQLLSYALWAMDTFKCGVNDVDLFKAYLGSGTLAKFRFGTKEIARAKVRIIQDVERMRTVDDFARGGVVEAFSPCGQPRVCALCPYQGICPKE